MSWTSKDTFDRPMDFDRASLIISGEMSIPWTRCPRLASSTARVPDPQARSRTRARLVPHSLRRPSINSKYCPATPPQSRSYTRLRRSYILMITVCGIQSGLASSGALRCVARDGSPVFRQAGSGDCFEAALSRARVCWPGASAGMDDIDITCRILYTGIDLAGHMAFEEGG